MANTAIYPETRLNDGPSTPKKITAIVVTIFFAFDQISIKNIMKLNSYILLS